MARDLIAKGTVITPKTGEEVPGTPPTQLFPLFIGGPTVVAAELHDIPNEKDTAKPQQGYKMYRDATGYVWVPKEEADQLFAPADETNVFIIEKAISQGLRIGVPVVPPDPPVVLATKEQQKSKY